jgi:class 3 adenylate cyclase/tetratricopeptide (TPR) repeat protein
MHCGFRNQPEEKFCGGCGTPTATAPRPPQPAPTLAEDHSAEYAALGRRHLTVLFCDLIDSTALSERLDPEELAALLVAYREACNDAVQRFDGYVSRYIGDAVLVYFGYPQAHEDDPERAVSAALDVVKGIDELNQQMAATGVTLSVRIGISTGMVVVGDIGQGDRREKMGVVGETPNVAARLQALAGPGSIVVGDDTFRLIEGLYVCEALGPQQLKGISRPVSAFRVLGESGMRSRFRAKAVRGLLPLVGREEEVGLLLKRWQRATQGEGQAVLLTGEAGVGKSRVLSGFQDHLRDVSKNRVLYICSPYYQDTPYYPVIEQLERSLRFAKHDSAAQKLAKLEGVISDLGLSLPKIVPPLAALLALPTSDRYPSSTLSADDRRKRLVHAIFAVLEAMAEREPVLMIVEDLHWIDPSTMEVLKLFADWLVSKRVLLICTHRPEFEPRWETLDHVVSVKLSRLSRRESTELIAKVAGGKALPGEVIGHIIGRTDGVPLFVEELTKTILESGLLRDAGDRYVLSGPLPQNAIPASLQDSLMARLDRLAPVKEVAQLAATLGRRFTQDLLAAVSKLAETALNDALSRLMDAELVYQRGLPPEVVYEFKHALVRDAAYNSLLRSKRQQLHLEIARILEEQFPAAVEASPELLSHHYQCAGLPDRAIAYSIRAGDIAASRYASEEASAHYQAAFDMSSSLSASNEAARLQIQATLKLASVSSKREQFERDLQNLERAHRLAEQSNGREQLSLVLYWIGRMNYVLGRFDRGVEYAEKSLEVAKTLGNDASLSTDAVNLLARIHCLLGEPKHASQYAARNIGQMHRLGNRIEEAAMSGVLAFAYGAHGRYREALKVADHGVDLAKGLEHLPTLAACYMYRAVVNGWFGKLNASIADFDQALGISERTGDVFRRHLVHGWQGEAYLLSDDFISAERELAQCLALGDQIGTSFHRAAFQAFLARIKLHDGDIEGARRGCEEAIRIAKETSQPWSLSIALRVHAETLLAGSPNQVAEAEEVSRTAISIQAQRECRCDLAWSHLTLGQVLQAKGDEQGAITQLMVANRAFEDMGMARGIEKVSAALTALRQSSGGGFAASAAKAE